MNITKPTYEQLVARNAELEAQAKAGQKALRVQTSKTGSGVVSVYGVNKTFPVSMHPDQWERVLDFAPAIRAHIAAGYADGSLLRKADKLAAKAAAPAAQAA